MKLIEIIAAPTIISWTNVLQINILIVHRLGICILRGSEINDKKTVWSFHGNFHVTSQNTEQIRYWKHKCSRRTHFIRQICAQLFKSKTA